jgi:hypothetical protein
MNSLYDFPAVFAVVMFAVVMARPPGVIEAEVQTIQTLLAAQGITQGHVLELACGTCAHDDWTIRCYRPWDLALLMQTLDGWTLDGFYTWQNADRNIATAAHYFTVVVAT